MSILLFIGTATVFGAVFFAYGYYVRRKTAEQKIRSAEIRADEIRASAEREMDRKKQDLQKEADKYLLRLKQEFDEKQNQRKRELDGLMATISNREKNIDEKWSLLNEKDVDLKTKEARLKSNDKELAEKKLQLERLIMEEQSRLQRVSGLGQEEAKRQLLKRLEQEVRLESSRMIKFIEDEAKLIAEKKAKHLIALAIQRCAAQHSMDSTIAIIHIPSEEMKGRIIGKEGRNIRTFEQATGVDVVIDDTPGTVLLSAFDPIRRETARISLERLIEDGRIHPTSIEEMVGKVKKEMAESIQVAGEETIMELGIGEMHPELIKLVGSLKYRSSYGQNGLLHSKEVAFIMNVFAGELGMDPIVAKRAGLLHDIGKVVSHEQEGPHAIIGGEIARKFGESPDVVHGIEAHHDDIQPKNILPILVQAADAMSASRPGARRENYDHYVKRLEKLEKVAKEIPGVENVFAIQAGREVRVLVNPNEVDDKQMPALAREIRKAVEENLNFPGQIRVVVIRETRATEFAASVNK